MVQLHWLQLAFSKKCENNSHWIALPTIHPSINVSYTFSEVQFHTEGQCSNLFICPPFRAEYRYINVHFDSRANHRRVFSRIAASTVNMAAQLNSILTYTGSWELGYSVFLSCLLILFVNQNHIIKVVLAANSDENPAVPSLPGVPVMNYLRNSKFSEGYVNLWGSQHQNVSDDESSITLTLDRSSGNMPLSLFCVWNSTWLQIYLFWCKTTWYVVQATGSSRTKHTCMVSSMLLLNFRRDILQESSLHSM
jgi:hypothetical protein